MHRVMLATAAVLGSTLAIATQGNDARAQDATTEAGVPDGLHDFDFLIGKWEVVSRRRKVWLAGNDEWVEMPARAEVMSVFNGYGNVDTLEIKAGNGSIYGTSLRTFNPNTGAWTIHWIDSGAFEVSKQVIGKFENGVGTLYGEEPYKDSVAKLRFIWRSDDADHAHWEQAYYDDANGAWETNWTLDFTRAK